MTSELTYITPVGLQRIQNEILWLQRIERPKIVEEVSYAAALGDRSENAEYIYGKKRLRQIDSRLGYLIRCLNRIQVVDPVAVGGERVKFGATVVIEDEDGESKTWRIYGRDEVSVEDGVISYLSPLGRALFGSAAGDVVTYRTPGGKREVEVLEVRFDPQEPEPEPEWKSEL